MDVLSNALLALKVQSMLVSSWQLQAPWGVDNSTFKHAFCLCVMSGICCFRPKEGAQQWLQAGDILLCPRGGDCGFSSAADSPLSGLAEIWQYAEFPGFAHFAPSERLEVSWGGQGEQTRLVILAFELYNQPSHPLLEVLPDFIYFSAQHASIVQAMKPALNFLAGKEAEQGKGFFAVASHLAEWMYISLLRDFILSQQQQYPAWLGALKEPGILRALHCIHTQAREHWDVAALAKEAGMSRTGFSNRFRELVQRTPIDYLNHWRIILATQLLRERPLPISYLSAEVGFGSERVFRRVFKQKTGISPQSYKKQHAQL